MSGKRNSTAGRTVSSTESVQGQYTGPDKIQFRLSANDQDIADILSSQENQSQYIREAIRQKEHYDSLTAKLDEQSHLLNTFQGQIVQLVSAVLSLAANAQRTEAPRYYTDEPVYKAARPIPPAKPSPIDEPEPEPILDPAAAQAALEQASATFVSMFG